MTAPILPVMTGLLTSLRTQMDEAVGGVPAWMSLVPANTVPMDYCGDDCGMGFVRLVTVFPSTAFPLADQNASKCASSWGVRAEVGVYRCLPVEAPTEEESATASIIQFDDMERIRAAITCAEVLRPRLWLLGPYTPAGPNGGCGGGSWQVTFQIM